MEPHLRQWHSTEKISLIIHPGKLASSSLTTAVSKLPIQSTNQKKKKPYTIEEKKNVKHQLEEKQECWREQIQKDIIWGDCLRRTAHFMFRILKQI